MITIPTYRTHVQVVAHAFFPYINLHKATRIANLGHTTIMSDDYLSAVIINCLLDDVELLLSKKLVNTTSLRMKLKLSDAQAVVIYKTLLALPIDQDNYFHHLVRNEWIQLLDQQIISRGIYRTNRPLTTAPAAAFEEDDFDE